MYVCLEIMRVWRTCNTCQLTELQLRFTCMLVSLIMAVYVFL